jgi:hypothetical protein
VPTMPAGELPLHKQMLTYLLLLLLLLRVIV